MEINITSFFENAEPFEFSASIAERGKNAGPETWANAKEEAQHNPFLNTPEELQYFRDYCREYGAWDDEERAAWGEVECNALLIQIISGNIREGGLDCEEPHWARYEKDAEAGRCSGNIYKSADRIYYSLCH